MLAAVYHGPNDLRVEQVSVPKAGTGELVLRVATASICGTDLRILGGHHRMYPDGTIRIPGHEVVGTVAEIGAGLAGYALGQRVFVAPNMGCGHCRECVSGANNLCVNYDAIGITLDGGFAEYMRVPAQAVLQGNVMPIADDVDAAVAALVEPFACVLRGQNALHIQPGDVVLVIGAGPIGIMHTKLARARGAGPLQMLWAGYVVSMLAAVPLVWFDQAPLLPPGGLDLGMAAARRLRDVRKVGWRFVAFAIVLPLVHGTAGAAIGVALGFSIGGAAVFGAMLASASYIAAPAAVRTGLPEANPSLYLTAALGITFPFNLSLGIPLYLAAARYFAAP